MVAEVDLFGGSECIREDLQIVDDNCSSSEESTTNRRFLGSGRTGIAGGRGDATSSKQGCGKATSLSSHAVKTCTLPGRRVSCRFIRIREPSPYRAI